MMNPQAQPVFPDGFPKVYSLLDIKGVGQFQPVPGTWSVVLSDVQGSTRAVKEGRYKDVNAAGAACITAVLNALDRIEIPFVFGGDGATFLVEPEQLDQVLTALNGVKQLVAGSFDLTLRVGHVTVDEIRKEGADVALCVYEVTSGYRQALFVGGGLDKAESIIKERAKETGGIQTDAEPDLSGFECRWDHIPSPGGEVVALLIKSLESDTGRAIQTYQEVLRQIDRIYKLDSDGHPLAQPYMRTTLSWKKLSVEQRMTQKTGQSTFRYHATVWFRAALGRVFEWTVKTVWPVTWTEYKDVVRKNADYRKLDDMLRMLVSGTAAQRLELTAYLERLHAERRIIFGMHHSPETLVTCMVLDRMNRHCHFVDGSQGGYTVAAIQLKEQRKLQARAL
jgi:hypothetical protein